MPSHYLIQYWVIVNWTLRNKFQWNFHKNIKLFIHANASENIVCNMVTILSRGENRFKESMFSRLSSLIRRNLLAVWTTELPQSMSIFTCTGCPVWQLTHLPLDKMAAILQTIFSDAFSWMISSVLWLKFHWNLFLRVRLTITQYCFR